MWKIEEDIDRSGELVGELEDGNGGGEVHRKPGVMASTQPP